MRITFFSLIYFVTVPVLSTILLPREAPFVLIDLDKFYSRPAYSRLLEDPSKVSEANSVTTLAGT